MAEELIGVFMSSHIKKRGTWADYGIYVTTDRIFGVKGGWKEKFGSGLEAVLFDVGGAVWGPIAIGLGLDTGSLPGQTLSKDDSVKAIELLEQKKDFEVRREDLEEVRLERKKGALKRLLTHWGDVVIKTPKKTYRIWLGVEQDVQILKDMFSAFNKDKFLVVDK